MKNIVKEVYYNLLKIKSRIFFGKPVLVTMYHRVSNIVGDKLDHLTVSNENFEKQLLYFKEKYQVLKLDEDWSSLKKTGLVVTFDDGYADNIINALPLLEKYHIPATIFVTTLNISTKSEFWWDRLVFDYSHCKDTILLPNQKDTILKSDQNYKYITNSVHVLTNEDKENWFLEFEKLNEIPFFPRDAFRSLTKSELKILSEHPLITLGIHTHNHYSLGNLSYELQRQELLLSIKKIDELTTNAIQYLALPHGSYNLNSLKIADELNLKGILLANNYYSSSKNKESKKINRILMPNITEKELVKYMNKFDFKVW